MHSAAALRLQIETALGTRIPGALTPRPRILRDLAPTSVPELDVLLDGGLPIGAITEFFGPRSSGRTTLAMTTLAEMTQAGKAVAWVDASDALDPESAATAGIDLSRLLWVRCGQGSPASSNFSFQQPTSQSALLLNGSRMPAPGGGGGSPHPRSEARGLSNAIDAFLQPDTFARTLPPRHYYNQSRKDRMVGTPGAPNRKLPDQSFDRTPQDPRPFPRRARDREEQAPTDRQPNRRQALYARQATGADSPRTLQSAQIANTAAAAHSRPQPGHWTDNSNNAHGRALQTPPNAIAAGLPRFHDMEAHTAGQGQDSQENRVSQNSTPANLFAGVKVSLLRPGSAEPQVLPSPFPLNQPKANQSTKKHSLAGERPANLTKAASPLWQALDQALRATDLLLAAGGFSALVLDLGSIPPEFAWRIPLATWFRFRTAADRARTVLLVLTQHPCARSSAELVLRFAPAEPQAATKVLTGAQFRVQIDRRRFDSHPTATPPPRGPDPTPPNTLHLVPARKPPQRAAVWHRAAAWAPFTKTGTEPSPSQGGHHA